MKISAPTLGMIAVAAIATTTVGIFLSSEPSPHLAVELSGPADHPAAGPLALPKPADLPAAPEVPPELTPSTTVPATTLPSPEASAVPQRNVPGRAPAGRVPAGNSSRASKGGGAKKPSAAPEAREALSLVGLDEAAERVWVNAINDPTLPVDERRNLIEDLNEDGFPDPKHVTPDDLPLIVSRLKLIEHLAPDAIDDANRDAFAEAYKDLINMADKLTRQREM